MALWIDKDISKTTNKERAVLYLLTGMTVLRKKELFNLCWDDINLSADNAFVGVKASIAKTEDRPNKRR